MKMWVYFTGFLAMASQMITGEHDSKTNDSPRVIGGYEIDLQTAPFLASMQTQGMHYCGGAILTLSHVISGCHCLAIKADLGMRQSEIQPKPVKDMTVVVGTENIRRPTEYMQKRTISDIRLHPNCSYELILVYDFALAFLSAPLNETIKVRPFTLVSPEKDVFDRVTEDLVGDTERQCYVAGWGSTEIDPKEGIHHASPVLKAARMSVIPDDDCRDKLGQLNDKYASFDFAAHGQLCTLSHGGRKNESDCRGDSGGPFFCGSRVYGVVSYGYKCGQWDVPNVYAKISYAVDWLKELNLTKLVRATDEALVSIRNVRKSSRAAPMKELQKYVFLSLTPTLYQLITASFT